MACVCACAFAWCGYVRVIRLSDARRHTHGCVCIQSQASAWLHTRVRGHAYVRVFRCVPCTYTSMCFEEAGVGGGGWGAGHEQQRRVEGVCMRHVVCTRGVWPAAQAQHHAYMHSTTRIWLDTLHLKKEHG